MVLSVQRYYKIVINIENLTSPQKLTEHTILLKKSEQFKIKKINASFTDD